MTHNNDSGSWPIISLPLRMWKCGVRSAWGLPYAATVREIHEENQRTQTFIFDTALEATPGQFVMAWLPRLDDKPFSLANADPLAMTVARVGPFTEALHRLNIGNRVWFRGPFGHGFEIEGQRILLVGGGYGVAPLHFLARCALAEGRQVITVIGARTAADLLFVKRFRTLGIETLLTTEDGSVGARGLVTDATVPLLKSGRIDSLYACGPHGMLEALEQQARQYGIPAQLSWEAYMRCGVGLCGSCEHKDARLLCLDGPVLRAGDRKADRAGES